MAISGVIFRRWFEGAVSFRDSSRLIGADFQPSSDMELRVIASPIPFSNLEIFFRVTSVLALLYQWIRGSCGSSSQSVVSISPAFCCYFFCPISLFKVYGSFDSRR